MVFYATHPVPKKSDRIRINENNGQYELNVLHKTFILQPTTIKELKEMRKNRVPTFVLKVSEKLYYAEVPAQADFSSAVCFPKIVHQCAGSSGYQVCQRLCATSDEDGGCAKVRNKARGIEYYKFITLGYEAFSTSGTCLYVAECTNYKPDPPRKAQTTISYPF